MMKKFILSIICTLVILVLSACNSQSNKPINVNVEYDSSINGTVFGYSALTKIGNSLYYDTTTRIVYWWNGKLLESYSSTTPTPYYAPNGLPYRYNPETNTFEEIRQP